MATPLKVSSKSFPVFKGSKAKRNLPHAQEISQADLLGKIEPQPECATDLTQPLGRSVLSISVEETLDEPASVLQAGEDEREEDQSATQPWGLSLELALTNYRREPKCRAQLRAALEECALAVGGD